jgi:hypothetical protein
MGLSAAGLIPGIGNAATATKEVYTHIQMLQGIQTKLLQVFT